jgi:hypothetical protein
MNEQEIERMITEAQSGEVEVAGETRREYADATMSVSWAFGALMEGWITYAESKVHFKLESIGNKTGFYAGAGFTLHNATLKPEFLINKVGDFIVKDTIIEPGKHVMELQIFVGGESVFDSALRFIVWGAGTGELLEGSVSFSY